MSFSVYKYQHPDFGPVMLLLDDNEPQEKEPATFRTIDDQLKGRGSSHNSNLPIDKKSLEKKSIQKKLRLSSEKKKKKIHLPSLYPNRYD